MVYRFFTEHYSYLEHHCSAEHYSYLEHHCSAEHYSYLEHHCSAEHYSYLEHHCSAEPSVGNAAFRSFSRCLRILPLLPAHFIFPSIMCCILQFQERCDQSSHLCFSFVVCRTFLSSLALCHASSFFTRWGHFLN